MKKNILLVEYNPDTIDAVKEILEHEKLDITTAGDAESAKKRLSKQEFHLAIIEALLPKSHGFILSQYISENYPATKIIITSEKIKNMDYKHDALKHGACEFLEKPFVGSKFREKVLKHLEVEEKEKNRSGYLGETTKINILPFLEDRNSKKGKKSVNDEPGNKIEGITIKENSDPYEIKLE
jgi:DNA-binding NtrC family response regulator